MQSQENDDAPRSVRERIILGMAEVIKTPDWWNLPVSEAVGIAQRASGGRVPPHIMASEFQLLVRSRGLEAVEG